MPTIAIQLDPEQLTNPDLELRYEVADRLEAATNGLVRADAYDYGRTSERITVFLKSTDTHLSVQAVMDVLRTEPILGNRLLECGTVVAVSETDFCDDERQYSTIHPDGAKFSLE